MRHSIACFSFTPIKAPNFMAEFWHGQNYLGLLQYSRTLKKWAITHNAAVREDDTDRFGYTLPSQALLMYNNDVFNEMHPEVYNDTKVGFAELDEALSTGKFISPREQAVLKTNGGLEAKEVEKLRSTMNDESKSLGARAAAKQKLSAAGLI